jgi:hypothetical protein
VLLVICRGRVTNLPSKEKEGFQANKEKKMREKEKKKKANKTRLGLDRAPKYLSNVCAVPPEDALNVLPGFQNGPRLLNH